MFIIGSIFYGVAYSDQLKLLAMGFNNGSLTVYLFNEEKKEFA